MVTDIRFYVLGLYCLILFIWIVEELGTYFYNRGVVENNQVLIHSLFTDYPPLDYLSLTIFLRLNDGVLERYAITTFLKRVRRVVKKHNIVILDVREIFLSYEDNEFYNNMINRIFLPLQSIKDNIVLHDLPWEVENKIISVLNAE